ncbi:hypothetical protein, partial [Frankia torreyi]|uniref:hypothetical protein n=2 Tax=Frankia TaxID=1854 RepID=UPI001A7E41A6
VKDWELDKDGRLRVNPLWSRLEDFSPKHLEASPAGALWQFAVGVDGQVFVGSESVTSIVSAAELDELFAWMSPHNPGLTRDQLE